MVLYEYKLLSSIQHCNILTVYERIPAGYIMELIPNDLITYINQNFSTRFHSVPLRDKITEGLLKAVSYLHQNDIAHLDIKPENILLTADGEAKLADFGLSLRFRDEAGRCIYLKEKRGSLPYVSPEILSGKEKTSMPPIDVWACGIVMYALFTGGRLPFNSESVNGILQQQLQGPVVVPRQMKDLLHYLPDYVDYFNAIQQVLNTDPKNRPSVDRALGMLPPIV